MFRSLIILFFLNIFCFAQVKAITSLQDTYSIKTYNTPNIGWGYDILKGGKTLIHQPHIPAVSGNKGFKTKAEALKVATLMKNKIQKNIMPPTIAIKELDSLKIKYN